MDPAALEIGTGCNTVAGSPCAPWARDECKPTARFLRAATLCTGTNVCVYKTDEELFHEALVSSKLSGHPRATVLSACAASLLHLRVDSDDLEHMTHEEVLVLAKRLGFEFDAYEELRIVLQALTHFYSAKAAHELAEAARPFRAFVAHIYRDRHGQLMAQFSMGKTTFRSIPLEESFERKFALVYQDTLVEALKLRVGAHGIHQSEDSHRSGK